MSLQEQIADRLKQVGVSRYKLAKDTGINESQLSRFFNGKINLSFERITQIAEYLECEIKLVPMQEESHEN